MTTLSLIAWSAALAVAGLLWALDRLLAVEWECLEFDDPQAEVDALLEEAKGNDWRLDMTPQEIAEAPTEEFVLPKLAFVRAWP